MAKQSDAHPDGCWPSCDDDQPGVSIRPLGQADLAALLAHLHHLQDQDHILRSGRSAPVVAVRVRASVGRPGASAQGEYQRRRATELATWARCLPWRIVALMAAWLVAARVAPNLAGPAGVTVAAGLGWLLPFRRSPDTMAWRRGAAGERRTARLLAPLERRGWAVLHDLAIPGSQANIDHLVIGPGGVVAIDSKHYQGRLQLDADGMVWRGRHLLVSALRKTLWEADQADEVLGIADLQVAAIVAVHGASIPWGHAAGRGGHRHPGPAAAGPAGCAAARPWAGAGGLAGRPGPAAVPRRRLTGRTSWRCKRYCCAA